jgi:DNA mismatch repair protein MSH3
VAAFASERNLDAVRDYYAQAGNEAVHALPASVRQTLGVLLAYLQEFGLDRMLRVTANFVHFSSHAHMVLSGNTLHNLEILREQSGSGERGSLFWLLNHARTPMGARLIRSWVCHPLLDRTCVLHPPCGSLAHPVSGQCDRAAAGGSGRAGVFDAGGRRAAAGRAGWHAGP